MSTGAVDIFVREARTYCSFVETASGLSLADRLRMARERLLSLYSAARSLPAVEPDESDASPSPDGEGLYRDGEGAEWIRWDPKPKSE